MERFRTWITLLLSALLLASATAAAGVPDKKARPAYAEEQTILQTEQGVPEPGWFDSASGRVHVDRHYLGQYGSTEGTVLVQRGGNTWRHLRNGPLATLTGTLVLVVPLLLFGFYIAFGPVRTEQPDTGRKLVRFDAWDRLVHWATAISFVLLAVTGLIIMFGKLVLRPWMGHDIFAAIAWVSKYIHNFVGPLFIFCSVIMFFTFVRRNFFTRVDWQWVRSLGGMVSHKHVPAGYFNAGEKIWFWLGVTLLGLLMSVTGLVMDFVTFGQTRYVLQVANVLHVLGGAFYMAAAIGHIYMGTIGTPGAYQAMRHGTVDEEWARSHHALWYEEIKRDGGTRPSGPVRGGRT
ncbi:formate dehydrogenase subunit gamma [Pseudoduganella sp. GCM10020061]|uniref:formate dehydrogenase subunit gamma n=1 Tax=Pseudoduganella sp. GCM10020061 TaxID=3317345 RepID=UPI0036335644